MKKIPTPKPPGGGVRPKRVNVNKKPGSGKVVGPPTLKKVPSIPYKKGTSQGNRGDWLRKRQTPTLRKPKVK